MGKNLQLTAVAMIIFGGLMYCNDNGVEPPTVRPPYKKHDGFTSATRKLRVDSILAYPDSALIYWWEYYEDEAQIVAYRIEWGTDPGNYTDTINLRPFPTQTVTISRIPSQNGSLLSDSTTYYGQFYRDWHGTIKKTAFSFTTPSREWGAP